VSSVIVYVPAEEYDFVKLNDGFTVPKEYSGTGSHPLLFPSPYVTLYCFG